MVKTRFSALTALAALVMVLGLGFSSCKDRVSGPGEKSPRLGKGAGLLEAKKYREAEAELRKAVEENLNSARAHHLLGMALFRQGGDRLYEAFKEIDIACNLEPTPERLAARSELGPIAAARLVEEIAGQDGFELSGDRLEAARRLSRPYLTEAALKAMLKLGDPRTAERIREALSSLDLFEGLAEIAQNPLYSFRARMAALYLMADHPGLEQELSPYLTALFMIGLEQCEPWEMVARRDPVTGAVVSACQDQVMDLARRDLDKMFFTLAEVIQKVSEEIDQDTRFECLSMSLHYFFDAPDFELLKYELELPAIEPAWASFAPVFEFKKRPVRLLEAIIRIGILLDFGPEFIERSAAAAGDTALELLADDDLSVNIAGVFMLSVLTEGPFDAESILAGLEPKQLETALAEIEAFYRRFLDAARSDPGSLPQKLGLSEEDTKSFMTSFVYAVPKVHQSMASALTIKSEQAGEPREIASLTAPAPSELPGLIDFKVFQLEARLNLSSIFSAQVSYFGEHNAFADSFEELAWSPLEDNRYAYLMGEDFLPDAGESMTREQAVETLQKLGIATGSSDRGFTAAALANFDADAGLDIWTVNDLRDIRQVSGD